MKVIGLISGTSSDGIDAALVDIGQRRGRIDMKLLAFEVYPYPRSLQRQLIDLASGFPHSVAALCHLNFYVGELFSEAACEIAKKYRISLRKIALIGSHGQTVHHLPVPKREGKREIRSTLQIGEPSVIAERTGITTVADFRPRDMAAGGEGAPLTPYLHALLFSHTKRSRAIVNIGGISNVTYLKAGASLDQTLAFDMGPGNMLIDGLVRTLTGGRKEIDKGGTMARRGKVDTALLSELMRHPFIRRKPQKSTGREMFGQEMVGFILQASRRQRIPAEDLIATATAFTAAAISENIQRFLLSQGGLDEVIVGGGGVRNPVLMGRLAEALDPIPVEPFEAVNQESRAIEAMTFALLAYQTLHLQPTNIPSVTGARHPVLLGKIIPGALSKSR
ncbi:MAG: anhydro-N-acetylmuramic acid kinase [Nitrospirae bacterium]|nr:anhydro-N-acetylmuramic acid kinase [Candidatus Manganitrophaceae bacterium]